MKSALVVVAGAHLAEEDALSLFQLRSQATSGRPNEFKTWATCAAAGVAPHIIHKQEDELKLCRCWGDVHCSHVWFDQKPGGPQHSLETAFHYQYSGFGASRYASACDGSWEIQIFQCTDNPSGTQTAVAVKAQGVLIEAVAGGGIPRAYVNGKKYSEEVKILPNGLAFKFPLTTQDAMCVSLDGQFDLSLGCFDWGNQLDQVLFVPKSVCTTEDRTICGDPANIGNEKEAHGISINHKAMMNKSESLFSSKAWADISTKCSKCKKWKACEAHEACRMKEVNECSKDPKDEPIVNREPKEVCDEKSSARWSTVQAVCASLKENHPNFYQDCLLDQCYHLDPGEEEGIEDIAGEEEPVAKCVNAPCDVNPCFSTSPQLSFDKPSQNNLGGHGPDDGAEEMRFSNVATIDGTKVDLVVEALSDYEPYNSTKNGLKGEFGKFNLKPGTEVELEFSFVDQDGAPYTMSELAFSFLDFDTGKGGQKSESMTVCGVDNVALNEASSIETSSSNGCYTIRATDVGKSVDNPHDSSMMSAVQMERTAAVLLRNRDKFTANFMVGDGKGRTGRAFMFNGKPTVACPQNRAQPEEAR